MKKVMVVGDVIEDIIVIAGANRSSNTDNPSSISATPGGSGANFAVWLASLGVSTELTARVGKADLNRLATYFNSVGVAPNLQSDDQLETGRIVVLVEGNSRTFFTDRGANQNLDTSSLSLSGFDVLYLSGYSVVTLGVEKTQSLIDSAGRAGALVAIDPGSTSFIEQFGVSNFLSAISGADMIFPEAVGDLETYKKFREAAGVPILANITEFGKTPLFTVAELRSANVDIVLYPLSAFRAMNKAAELVYKTIRSEGTQKSAIDHMQTREELYQAIDYYKYEEALDKFQSEKNG